MKYIDRLYMDVKIYLLKNFKKVKEEDQIIENSCFVYVIIFEIMVLYKWMREE